MKKVIIENKADEYSEHFKNIGFTIKNGGTPRYICKASDPNSVNGIVYTFDDEDIDSAKLDSPEIIRGLRNIFHGHVGYDAASYGQLKIRVTPSEKITCRQLTTDDTWIADHINACGVFGAPGMGKTVGLAYLTFLFCKEAEKNNKGMEIVLMDQKLTFAQKLGIGDSSSFYYGERVLDGLEDAVAALDEVKLNPDGKVRLFVIDEMTSACNCSLLNQWEEEQNKKVKDMSEFVRKYQNSIFTKEQLIQLYEGFGVNNPKESVKNFRRYNHIEFISKKDVSDYLDLIIACLRNYTSCGAVTAPEGEVFNCA